MRSSVLKELVYLCRACGGPVKRNRLCKDHEAALKSVFSIDIPADKANIHPKRCCKRCYAVISQSNKTEVEGRIYFDAVEPTEWGRIVWCVEILAQSKREADPQKDGKGEGDHHLSHSGTETSTPYISSLRSRTAMYNVHQQPLASSPQMFSFVSMKQMV